MELNLSNLDLSLKLKGQFIRGHSKCLLISRVIVFFVFSSFSIVEVQSQEIGTRWDTWTPELQMRYRSISQTTLSPDGKYVAYVVSEPLMKGEKSEYLRNIWVAATDGSFNVQYTRGEKSATAPSFSPDCKLLAFISARGSEKNQIWVMRILGGEAKKITDVKGGISSFKWSPDGRYIAFIMSDPETGEETKQKKEKRDVRLVDQDYKYNRLYKIPVGDEIPDKRDTLQLTTGKMHVTEFDWSPDGKTIVFSHQNSPLINDGFIERDISTIPADSGKITPLINQPGVDNDPHYSPDGKWVAFVSNGGSPQPIGLGDVFIVPASGGKLIKLAESHDRSPQLIQWTADSKNILYTEFLKTSLNLFELPVDGSPARMITSGTGNYNSVAVDRSTGLIAFTWEDMETPVEVYYSPLMKFKAVRLSEININVPKPGMGTTEIINWTSADGKLIEGLLTFPVNYIKGNRYPLILNVHGGPAEVFAQGFTGSPSVYMIQTFAQKGYAIIRPNPRGSTGYGKDFRFANYMDWGFGDYEDLMAGVDKVIEMGIGSPDSLCLMGWSYGGYMTSFAVTRTNRFKAASMGAGLPDLISMVTTTDIPDYLTAHMGGEFWNDYETYEKHSAIFRIKNVTTPTQIIHGALDLRVPFTQGQEFYVALKRLGIPTEMIVYPRTQHGPSEPKFIMDVTPRVLTWFDKYLGKLKE
jgi:dipeptidyl aminopeptidase/acylaminoacyl peptidase